jgi:hypothetical protein
LCTTLQSWQHRDSTNGSVAEGCGAGAAADGASMVAADGASMVAARGFTAVLADGGGCVTTGAANTLPCKYGGHLGCSTQASRDAAVQVWQLQGCHIDIRSCHGSCATLWGWLHSMRPAEGLHNRSASRGAALQLGQLCHGIVTTQGRCLLRGRDNSALLWYGRLTAAPLARTSCSVTTEGCCP